ncbi:MAG: anhydro-N-acetylmuramic acid kinase, partial [Nitrospinota bacterium]
MKKTLKVIGLMSGTSADGVDTSIVEIGLVKKSVKLLKFKKIPYPKDLTRSIIDISIPGHGSLELVNHLNFSLGERFANADIKVVKDAGMKLSSIDLIG